MKKIFSILLLVVLLFNWFGYRVLVSFMEAHANTQLQTQLDENRYDEADLVSIKIPVTYLPYYNNSKSFERVDGQVEIQGVPYKYVKRRIYNDTLEMLCIPNHNVLKLQTAKNEFFKFTNDLKQGKKSTPHNVCNKVFSTDCYTHHHSFRLKEFDFPVLLVCCFYCPFTETRYASTTDHPPEHC